MTAEPGIGFIVREGRESDADGIARAQVDGWRHAYAHILPASTLERLSYEGHRERWLEALRTGEVVLVASTEDQVLGFASYGPNRFPEVDCDGELQAIYIHPSAHGHGVGKALVLETAKRLREDGYSSMVAFVFRENHSAIAFYERLGAVFADEGEYQVDGVYYPDASYVWHSLDDLIASADAP